MGAGGWLLVAASVTVAATAGVFVGFSTFVMRALGDLPASDAVRAMQAVNRRAPTPAFMALMAGSTLLAVVAAVVAVATGGRGLLAVVGAALAVVALGVTGAVNVPLNTRLDGVDPSAAVAGTWSAYAVPWTRANHARAALGLVAALVLAAAAVPS